MVRLPKSLSLEAAYSCLQPSHGAITSGQNVLSWSFTASLQLLAAFSCGGGLHHWYHIVNVQQGAITPGQNVLSWSFTASLQLLAAFSCGGGLHHWYHIVNVQQGAITPGQNVLSWSFTASLQLLAAFSWRHHTWPKDLQLIFHSKLVMALLSSQTPPADDAINLNIGLSLILNTYKWTL
ncbi:hypothetical protein C8R48DRAFT_779692 [Suillus tomentosus]|nr:hypothetical protein C8R48DRAFT_779692 [Suillus tomentosus]